MINTGNQKGGLCVCGGEIPSCHTPLKPPSISDVTSGEEDNQVVVELEM